MARDKQDVDQAPPPFNLLPPIANEQFQTLHTTPPPAHPFHLKLDRLAQERRDQ